MKRFKYLFMALVMVTCLLGAKTSFVEASSYSTGKAILPYYVQNSGYQTTFQVSNITDAPLSITVTLYNADGTIATDDGNSNTGRIIAVGTLLDYNDMNTNSTLTFTLNAHCTGIFRTGFNTTGYNGYGMINWSQQGNSLQGIIVNGNYTTSSGFVSFFQINGGLPF